MDSLKQKMIFWAALLLLAASVGAVWYLAFQDPGRAGEPDGVLVRNVGRLVRL